MRRPTTFPGAKRKIPRLDEISFCAWIGQAKPGERLEYHRGFLAHDTFSCATALSDKDRAELKKLASRAFWAFEAGLVHLVQERLATDRFAYIAIARPKPKSERAAASLSALLLDEAA
jgi:hypothetical protein